MTDRNESDQSRVLLIIEEEVLEYSNTVGSASKEIRNVEEVV